MSDQEEARIAASRHFDDLYSRWLVRPSPGNKFLNDRYGSIAAVHDNPIPSLPSSRAPSARGLEPPF